MQRQPDTHVVMIPPPSYEEAMGQTVRTDDNKYVSPTGHELYNQYQQTLNVPSIIGYQPQNNFYTATGTNGPRNPAYVPTVSAQHNPTSSAQCILPAQNVIHRQRWSNGKCSATCPITILVLIIVLVLIRCLMLSSY